MRDVAGTPPDGTVVGVLGQDALQHREEGLRQRDVDQLSLPRSLALMDCHHGTDDRVQRRDGIAQAQTDSGRRLPRLAGDEPQARCRLGDRAEGRLVAHRPGLAVAGDADDDEARIRGHERLGVEVPLLEAAGPEVLDEDVALERQLPHHGLVRRVMQVRDDRPLAAGLHEMPQRVALVPAHAPAPQRVAGSGLLDLDDIRPEVGQHPPGERPGDERAELEDAEVRQRSGCRFGLPLSRNVGHGPSIWTI